MPTPLPGYVTDLSAVENPDMKSSSIAWSASKRSTGLLRDQPTLACGRDHGIGVDPGAVVGDRNDDLAAFVARRDLQQSRLGLIQLCAPAGILDAVVDRVTDEMHQRLDKRVDGRAVEFRVAAFDLQVDLFAELVRQVADQTRQAREGGVDRHHAYAHDHVLDGLRSTCQFADCRLELGVTGLHGQLLDARTTNDELADHVQKCVQARRLDAHRRAGLRLFDGGVDEVGSGHGSGPRQSTALVRLAASGAARSGRFVNPVSGAGQPSGNGSAPRTRPFSAKISDSGSVDDSPLSRDLFDHLREHVHAVEQARRSPRGRSHRCARAAARRRPPSRGSAPRCSS